MVRNSPADELRRQIASALADEKAHDVPDVCSRYGLEEGTGEEAFSGKFRYVLKRLQTLSTTEVLRIGQAIHADYQNQQLADALAVIEDVNLPKISGLTRRRLIDVLGNGRLEGKLDLLEFLEPVYDLDGVSRHESNINSVDFSTRSIRDAVWQHCINNYDWDTADLLKYLDFLTCHQRQVFRLLERVVDPEVRDDIDQAHFVKILSDVLIKDGYTLQINGTISGTYIYKVGRAGGPGATPADDEISELMQRFDEAGIHDLWQKALQRRHGDPDGAITIARTYLEQTCKHILDEECISYADDADLPKLWGLCAEQLNLAPSQHTEAAFKTILGSCQNVVNTLGTIRNKIGDSHGQRGKPVRARPRHAQLAVNLAGSMATFLLATWGEQKATATR